MKSRGKVITLAAVAVVVAGGAAAMLNAKHTEKAARIDALEPLGSGPLDGKTFVGMLGPNGEELDVADVFVFENGTFVSKECELRCDYPARPYRATKTDEGWAFESATRCPYKDATIMWRGKVSDDRVSGVATWTLRRWYWTIERDFAFEAQLSKDSETTAKYN